MITLKEATLCTNDVQAFPTVTNKVHNREQTCIDFFLLIIVFDLLKCIGNRLTAFVQYLLLFPLP